MVKFISEWHPELIIRDLGVRFRSGVAVVDDAVATRVRELPAEWGIREAEPDTADPDTAAERMSPDSGDGNDVTTPSAVDRSMPRVRPRRPGRR